ncbi:methenyltetrahydromethanopterin cyclohydrolase [Tardisphaera miroshnichenkoae]
MAISLNATAAPYYYALLERSKPLKVIEVKIGKFRVVDAGVRTPGSHEAGKLVSQMCACGMLDVNFGLFSYGSVNLPSVQVHSDMPALSFLGGTYGDWEIEIEDFKAIGSGPARALALNRSLPRGVKENVDKRAYSYRIYSPAEIYSLIGHREASDEAYLLLETSTYPDEKVLTWISEQVGVEADRLHVVIARTSSMTMSVRLASSVAETGLHKLVLLGLDPKRVKTAYGSAPLPPTVFGDDDRANGMANDAIRYGGSAYYELEEGALDGLNVGLLPPTHLEVDFYSLMKGGFYSVDLGDFSAAQFTLASGRSVLTVGRIREDLLLASFFGSKRPML